MVKIRYCAFVPSVLDHIVGFRNQMEYRNLVEYRNPLDTIHLAEMNSLLDLLRRHLIQGSGHYNIFGKKKLQIKTRYLSFFFSIVDHSEGRAGVRMSGGMIPLVSQFVLGPICMQIEVIRQSPKESIFR